MFAPRKGLFAVVLKMPSWANSLPQPLDDISNLRVLYRSEQLDSSQHQ